MYDIKKVIAAPICNSVTLDCDEVTVNFTFSFLFNSNIEDGTMQPRTLWIGEKLDLQMKAEEQL
jgi:hypothetical protein